MRFLIDAQLPRRFCSWLNEVGFDAKHTLDLPSGNRTTDAEIVEIAGREKRVVVTKDDDFVQSFFVNGRPDKLLLIATGNLSNAELERLIRASLHRIVEALDENQFLELGRDRLIVRA
jgi:predicted nuclease of predicted toxin-antitoxin system